MNQHEGILFYVKFPENGKVKTRLAKEIGDEHALELYKCFILDMIETLSEIPQKVCVCYFPEHVGPYFRRWLGQEHLYFPQQGGDLGERMQFSFEQAFRSGFKKVVVIGSDLPDLPSHLLVKTFEDLNVYDTVIGPAADGGYYLLGFRDNTYFPAVFDEIIWSTASVCDQTLKKIEQSGLTCSVLPVWHDVDNFSELQLFYERNQQEPRRAKHSLAYLEHAEQIVKLFIAEASQKLSEPLNIAGQIFS